MGLKPFVYLFQDFMFFETQQQNQNNNRGYMWAREEADRQTISDTKRMKDQEIDQCCR